MFIEKTEMLNATGYLKMQNVLIKSSTFKILIMKKDLVFY